MDWLQWLIWLLVALSLSLGGAAPSEDALPPLTQTFDRSAAFAMSYPETWYAELLDLGLLLFAEIETLFNPDDPQPGPSIVVYRTKTLTSYPLEEGLERYLDQGPLRNDHFALVGKITPATLDGYDARAAVVEGREFSNPDNPLMRSYILAVKISKEVFYIFSASAPAEDWEEDWPLMQAILASADIRE